MENINKLTSVPKVSICIPVYNRAKYIAQCVESAMSQDYKNLEIIISDNCSTDGTTEIIEKYLGDKRIRFYRNETNTGIYYNYKALADYVTGEWMIFLASDDYWLDGAFISKAVERIRKNPDITAVCGGYKMFYEDDESRIDDYTDDADGVLSGRDIFLRGYDEWYRFAIHATVMKTSIVKNTELNAFDMEVSAFDLALFWKLCLTGDIYAFRKPFLMFRMHESNHSRCDSNEEFESEFIKDALVPVFLYNYARDKKLFQKNVLDKWLVKNVAFFLVLGPERFNNFSSKINKYEIVLKERGFNISEFGFEALLDRLEEIKKLEEKIYYTSEELEMRNMDYIRNELRLIGQFKIYDGHIAQNLEEYRIKKNNIENFMNIYFYSKVYSFLPPELKNIPFKNDVSCLGSFEYVNDARYRVFIIENKEFDMVGIGWIYNITENKVMEPVYIMLAREGSIKYVIETKKYKRPDIAATMKSDLYEDCGYYFIIPANVLMIGEYDIVTASTGKGGLIIFDNHKKIIIIP